MSDTQEQMAPQSAHKWLPEPPADTRGIFRLAVMASAAAIIICHNHPSGDPTPSEADIKITRDLIRAGQLLKIEVLDHIVMGNPSYTSLRTLGHFL